RSAPPRSCRSVSLRPSSGCQPAVPRRRGLRSSSQSECADRKTLGSLAAKRSGWSPPHCRVNTAEDDTLRSMLVDLAGRVRNTRLPTSRPLLPLFDAVVNAIHAIEDAGVPSGRIDITLERDNSQGALHERA